MIRNSIMFISLGFVWLFLFSIPVGKNKSVFDVAHFYIVDTKPVYWAVQKVQGGIDATSEATQTNAEEGVEILSKKLSKATKKSFWE